MLARLATLLRSIAFAPWFFLRPVLLRGHSPSLSTPSARAKARAQAQKSSATDSPASAKPQPKPAKVKAPRMEPANGTASVTTAEEKSKLEAQATAKGDLSYSYWAGKGGGAVPLPEPRKLTDEERAELERQTAATAASAWNAAGTFEERGATPWAKTRLAQLIRERELPGGDVAVVDVNSCEGEANIFIVRGKKRCGFDFELQLAWKAVPPRADAVEIRGLCKVLNFCSDDPDDLELRPEVSHPQTERAADEAGALLRLRTVLQPQLLDILGQLLQELKAR